MSNYQKLPIHPEKVPPGYWELGVRRCEECEKDWPNILLFDPSPCCNSDTLIIEDEDVMIAWRDACKLLLEAHFTRYYESLQVEELEEELDDLME